MKQHDNQPATPAKNGDAATTRAAKDFYGSGYENKRDDYRSKKTKGTNNTDSSSHTTEEANTHRSGQKAGNNDHENDKDSKHEK